MAPVAVGQLDVAIAAEVAAGQHQLVAACVGGVAVGQLVADDQIVAPAGLAADLAASHNADQIVAAMGIAAVVRIAAAARADDKLVAALGSRAAAWAADPIVAALGISAAATAERAADQFVAPLGNCAAVASHPMTSRLA